MTGSFYPGAKHYTEAFAIAEEYLAGGRTKVDRPVSSNTRLRRIDEDTIALVLHNTAVVTYYRDGTIGIYSGGWNTPTTKKRISEFSPFRPNNVKVNKYADPEWILGDSGERTPARVQKCRTCSGKGTWMENDYCQGPSRWDHFGSGESTICPGETVHHDVPMVSGLDENGDYFSNYAEWRASMRTELCEHGRSDRHPTTACEHGVTEWQQHKTGQSQRSCYRCDGEGTVDYGSKVIYDTVNPDLPFLVNSYGKFIALLGVKPSTNGNGYATPKSKSTPFAQHQVKHQNQPSGPSVGSNLVAELRKALPNIDAEVEHPAAKGAYSPVHTVVVSLNDVHRWSREQIADWLDTLDVDLRF